jgi:molybdopterin adenylyltransferase
MTMDAIKIETIKIGIVSCSDRASTGVYEDKGLPALKEWLSSAIQNPIQFEARLIPDEQAVISQTPWLTRRCLALASRCGKSV